MDENGNATAEHMHAFSRLLGVRDGTDRNATNQEITEVSKHLYFYFVNEYNKGIRTGKWDHWSEEKSRPENTFQDHSTRDDAGVFDGFDFPKWAAENLVNGLEGTKAVEVCQGPTKKKTMIWEAPLCGIGLKKAINQGIEDHLAEQGAMAASARNAKKANIGNDITHFLLRKGWEWLSDTHLFMDGPNQRKMNLYCGKKIGGEHYILMKSVAESV